MFNQNIYTNIYLFFTSHILIINIFPYLYFCLTDWLPFSYGGPNWGAILEITFIISGIAIMYYRIFKNNQMKFLEKGGWFILLLFPIPGPALFWWIKIFRGKC
jgi:hypothetical protein